ncbi:MAG: glycosyltransferase [Bacteroidales bacterium]|nr:glycosyltransferase [Bacteroidales bacterium]
MGIEHFLHSLINVFFLVYGLTLFVSYITIGIFSSLELTFYNNRNKYFNFNSITDFKELPTISVIAPCYNEEKSIVENVRSLLSLKYPDLDIIVVNDGSTDDSLKILKETYHLVRVNFAYEQSINTEKVRGIYKSSGKEYSQLIVIDKENGGKSDALNAGINLSRNELFLAIDVDCIIEQEAISRMVKPFLEEEDDRKVIASGGVVRIANNCQIENGQIAKVNFPKNIWAEFQTLEYMRVFTLGRMAWSRINGLLIISGAFGLFDRDIVLKIGGYDITSVGEDLELVLRMRKYMHNVEKKKYKVAFIPDPLCWTEVPSNLKMLSRQRNRWARGLIDTMIKHRDMFFNPKFGRIGMISFPYWLFFEWMAPFVEVIGISYLITMISLGKIDLTIVILFSIFAFSFGLLYSSFSVFYEKLIFSRYRDYKFLFKIFFISVTEIFIFHPLNTIFSLKGNYDYFIKKKRGWGKMKREGFNSN